MLFHEVNGEFMKIMDSAAAGSNDSSILAAHASTVSCLPVRCLAELSKDFSQIRSSIFFSRLVTFLLNAIILCER